MILGRRVHLLAGERARAPKVEPPAPSPDYLARGKAWARIYLMRDGTVVAEGKRGAAVLNGALADQVQAVLRNVGVREAGR